MIELTLLRAGMPDRVGHHYTVEVLQEMAVHLAEVPNVEAAWVDGDALKVRLNGNLRLHDFNDVYAAIESRSRAHLKTEEA